MVLELHKPECRYTTRAMREVAPLLRQFTEELDAVEGDVIDIACGSGQNG